jgi:hypothetical protein
LQRKKLETVEISSFRDWWRWWENPAVKDAFGAAVAGFAP